VNAVAAAAGAQFFRMMFIRTSTLGKGAANNKAECHGGVDYGGTRLCPMAARTARQVDQILVADWPKAFVSP
jgi:hypothetical protein